MGERTEPTVSVCFVASDAQLGGAEEVLRSLLAALGKPWIDEVYVLAEGPFVERLNANGIAATVVPCGRRAGLLTGALRLRRALAARPRALVHANGVKAALVSTMATAGTRIPVLWHKHDSARDGRLTRMVARRCALVVGVSSASIASLQGVAGVRAKVVENGVAERAIDRAEAREALTAEIGAPLDSLVVAMVGRLHPAKGQLDMVAVCDELRDSLPQLRLVIAGAADPHEPEFEAELRGRVQQLGLSERVSLLGYRDDALQVTAAADLLAMPSSRDTVSGWREGFPLAPLEAMLVGTPVVGYAEPGIAEVVGDCGELVPSGDRESLRDAVAALLDSPERRRSLSACGEARAQRFGLPRQGERMADCYREAAA